MKNLKHSKFKNTGMVFELLTRQVTSDVLNHTESKAIPILKKYFSKSTELAKELALYHTLATYQTNNKEKATQLIEAVLEAKARLNKSALNRQKYNLISELRNSYDTELLFQNKIGNYRVLASIYKLLEYSVADNPADIVNSKFTITEHICSKSKSASVKDAVEDMSQFERLDEDVRLLTYKFLVEKFNKKYDGLNESQKELLRQYITNVTESSEFRDYIIHETGLLKEDLTSLSTKVDDPIIKIKLKEVANLLSAIPASRTITEGHVLNLLRYHELVKETKRVLAQ